MNRHLYAISGLVILLTTVGVSTTKFKPAPPSSSAVTVSNTTQNPVPTMNMGGTVSVTTVPPITISGTPNVNVSNTPTVKPSSDAAIKVNNDAANPIPVTVVNGGGGSPANKQMVKGEVLASYLNVGTGSGTAYTVPAGKQLEIKEIFVYSMLPTTEALIYADIKIDGALFVQWPLEIQKQGTSVSGSYSNYIAVMHNCPFVAKAGDVISFDAGKSTNTNTGQFTGEFVGYLEDAS